MRINPKLVLFCILRNFPKVNPILLDVVLQICIVKQTHPLSLYSTKANKLLIKLSLNLFSLRLFSLRRRNERYIKVDYFGVDL